ncbi:MAG: hypothetical protein ACPG32_07330 [Akkermansiaceae bacterium]
MDKLEILSRIADRLKEQLATLTKAAKETHDASTGDESKSEGKYDTRGLEASYLAEAQAEQSSHTAAALRAIETFTPEPHADGAPITLGSLVETESDGAIEHFYLLPSAGGIVITHQGDEITTLSPESPLYQEMIDQAPGTLMETSDRMILDVF